MILTRTPYRISLFGGGTDYPDFITINGMGLCIGFTIDKYSYISVRKLPPFFDYHTRAVYSEIETVKSNHAIQHKAIKNTIKHLSMDNDALEIVHTSDLPHKTGLGTSSAFLVGLVQALCKLKSAQYSKNMIFRTAAYIEQTLMVCCVGYQDHAFATYGGLREIIFTKREVNSIRYTNNIWKELERCGLLFYTGITRNSTGVVSQYINTLSRNIHQKNILEYAKIASDMFFHEASIEDIGSLLSKSWESKKQINDIISNPTIDKLYDIAMTNNAYGGKLCGGGAGGCLFILADPIHHVKIVSSMTNEGCVHIPFKISSEGCEVILS